MFGSLRKEHIHIYIYIYVIRLGFPRPLQECGHDLIRFLLSESSWKPGKFSKFVFGLVWAHSSPQKKHTRVQNVDFVLVPIGLEGQYSCDANGGHARHDLSWFSD